MRSFLPIAIFWIHQSFNMKANIYVNSVLKSSGYVLLADDDEDDRLTMSQFFRMNGYRHHLLSSGKDLLLYLSALAAADLPSVIILDYSMPFYTGEEVLQILKASEAYRQIPVIVYSTEMPESRRKQLLSLGAGGCFLKGSCEAEYDNIKECLDCLLQAGRCVSID